MTETDPDETDGGVDREPYRTVAERARASFEVQGSEFIGHVTPASTVDAAEQFLEEVAEAYDDATHNVPAYRVRSAEGYLREYRSDDGEPSGSAGEPALNVLQGRDLEHVAVVVTRYYGGTNLGVGGLVRAYSRAVKAAVDAAGVVERHPHDRLTIRVAYDDSGAVRSVLESAGVEFDAEYDEAVTFDVAVRIDETEALVDRLRSTTSGRASIESARP